jgi:DNA-binding XRE family transcriptional regulator
MNDLSNMTGASFAERSGADCLTVAALRAELKLTLADMGERVGISKSQMHEVEANNRASLRVALAIEELSGCRIDAGALNEDVRLSRGAGCNSGGGVSVHAAPPSTEAETAS